MKHSLELAKTEGLDYLILRVFIFMSNPFDMWLLVLLALLTVNTVLQVFYRSAFLLLKYTSALGSKLEVF